MTTELVTGKKGSVHVDSADDGALYAAIAGKGEYVLQLGDKFACAMTTANKAHVASGHGLMQGRHWFVDDEGENLTIQNGTQGDKRNDLIVAHYECDPKNSNVEKVELVVLKGEPTKGTPADPAYTHSDLLDSNALINEMPLWRIPLDGITVGAPVQLFKEFAPAQDRWDSVSHGTFVSSCKFDSEWAGVYWCLLNLTYPQALKSDNYSLTVTVEKPGYMIGNNLLSKYRNGFSLFLWTFTEAATEVAVEDIVIDWIAIA